MDSLPSRPPGSQTTQDILIQCEDLALIGHFDEVLKILEPILEDTYIPVETQIEAHRTATRILTARGFPRAAEECILKACTINSESLSQQRLLSRDVHRAYVTIVTCGDNLEDDGFLDHAQDLLNQLHDIAEYDRDAVSFFQLDVPSSKNAVD